MSERDSGLGPFVIGIAVGVTLGLLFAREGGEAFRGKLAGRLRNLRRLAVERAGDVGALVIDAAAPEWDDDRIGSRRTGRRGRSSGEEDASSG